MSLKGYLLKQVTPEEYMQLKSQEQSIVSSVMNGFNDLWKSKVRGIKVTFKYNPKRDLIGIYVGKKEQLRLTIEGKGLSESENVVVGSLYSKLEEKLTKLRLPNEEWVDEI